MELTEQQAKDIDGIFAFAINRGFLESFGISYYQSKIRPELEKQYVYYLGGLIKNYKEKYNRNWIEFDGSNFSCNNHTKAFYEGGGLRKIYEQEYKQEQKEDTELKLALKTLNDYPVTKLLARLGFLIAFILGLVELARLIFGY